MRNTQRPAPIFFLSILICLFSFQASAEKPFDHLSFGLASAPGQAEDHLDDIWMSWGKQGKIANFKNEPRPEDRLNFWSHPEVELDLAAASGIQIYRFGVDWGRIMPLPHQFDKKVIEQYRAILHQIKDRKMKVMLTLMHHSIPKWAQDQGGWLNPEMSAHFIEFSKRMLEEYHSDVDYWITFNEANIFVTLAYTAGLWPPGEHRPLTSLLYFGPFKGETLAAMDRMADSHNTLYDWAHQHYPQIQMGLAHNMAYYTGKSWFNRWKAKFSDELMNWRFPERTRGHLDFFGFNYYGAEWLKGSQIDIDPEEEYSEAGRAIYPEGLYLLLQEIHSRFKLPIFITENGIADSKDIIRPSYLIEHLKAVEAAIHDGIPVNAYIVWTLSDNLEWSDGYCPKFGLVSVDRKSELKRTPRESYQLFQEIIQNREITKNVRDTAWNRVISHQGEERPFCRAPDGVTALSEPTFRKLVKKDWRFRPLDASK